MFDANKMAEEAKDSANSFEKNLPNISKVFVKVYDQIPLKNLRNMLGFELVLFFIALFGIILTIWNFQLITFEGISSIQTTVSINILIWRNVIKTAYNISWIQICLFIVIVLIRILFRKQTSLSLIQKHNLKLNANDEPIQEKQNIFEPFEKEASLRNHKVYFAIAITGGLVVIGYLNYFPRAEQLFPSFILSQYPYGFILKPAEYSTFVWINLIFGFGICNLFLFLVFFSLRQIKDMHHVISVKTSNTISSDSVLSSPDEDWRPKLPKPWKYMTIAERKEYQMKVIQLEKEHRITKEKEKLENFLQNEREKVRLGKDLYSQKLKEKKKLEELNKKENKKKKTQETNQEKYDFR